MDEKNRSCENGGKARTSVRSTGIVFDHSEPRPIREKIPENPKYEGKGRPTGKWRRALHSFSNSGLD